MTEQDDLIQAVLTKRIDEHSEVVSEEWMRTSEWLKGCVLQLNERPSVKAARALYAREGWAPVLMCDFNPEGPGSREDRTCDRCRKYVEVGTLFRTLPLTLSFAGDGHINIVFTLGICQECTEIEGITNGA